MPKKPKPKRRGTPRPNAKPPNAGKGRKKGVPNKITRDVRKTMALFAERNIGELEVWIDRVARRDPATAARLYLQALEYHVPKLSRMELENAPGSDGLTVIQKVYTYERQPGATQPVGPEVLPGISVGQHPAGH